MFDRFLRAALCGMGLTICGGCVVWHTDEMVLIKPSYSYVDGAPDEMFLEGELASGTAGTTSGQAAAQPSSTDGPAAWIERPNALSDEPFVEASTADATINDAGLSR